MKIGFNAKNEIIDPKELFGASKEFNFLVGYAKRRACVQIIGHRRFGKTSILKCLETYFNSEENSDIYPIFIDFTEVDAEIVGTANVYRYLIAITVAKLTKDKVFESKEEIRGVKVSPNLFWESLYDELSDLSSNKLQELFKELIILFSELTDKTFLFLFDEYEYLFKYGFDKPTGFTTLRNFSSKLTKKGLNPFGFFIAGIMTWEKLCSITKSGELNVIDQTVRIKPIHIDDFRVMWNYECSMISDCPKLLLEIVDTVYELSGGIPFYGKSIGSYILTNEELPNHGLLKSHFSELINSLELEQKDILAKLSISPSLLKENENVFLLRDSGLIVKAKNSQYNIRINLLRDYVKSINGESNNSQKTILPESFVLTDQITNLISNINATCQNNGKDFIFDILNEDESLYRDLRTPVIDRSQSVQFASSLYRIIYEKTKEKDVTKAKLPRKFSQHNSFIALVDIMRHTLGKGHIYEKMTLGRFQMSKEDMYLKLLGSSNEPFTAQDFSRIQINTLKLFITELKTLKSIIET